MLSCPFVPLLPQRAALHGSYQYLFIESICNDTSVLEQNYRNKMKFSPGAARMRMISNQILRFLVMKSPGIGAATSPRSLRFSFLMYVLYVCLCV